MAETGTRIEHRYHPVLRSPSGLALRDIVAPETCDSSLYIGEQWLEPGEEVPLHTHDVEEILTFTAGSGRAAIGELQLPFSAGVTLHIPARIPHGFANTGAEQLRLLVIFPIPVFAETNFLEPEQNTPR